MPLAKLTCPKCRATLKPAKPVPEGKLIKCPKCEETFKAGQETGQTATAATKPEAAKKPAQTAHGKPVYDEAAEESDGTYAVLKDEAEERKKAEKEERKRRKEERKRAREEGDDDEEDEDEDDEDEDDENDIAAQYLKNLKPRDPRGATQEAIVSPASWLLRTALIGFFGWVAYFVAFMLPVLFPNIDDKDPKAAAAAKSGTGKFKFNDKVLEALQDADLDNLAMGKVKSLRDREFDSYDAFINQVSRLVGKDDLDKVKKVTKKWGGKKDKYTHWWSAETILDENNTPWSILLFVFVMLLGMVQTGVIAMGSVKMQSLESYRWALTGCIVAIVPLVTFPLFVLITALFDLSDYLLEGDWADTSWMIGMVAFLWGPVVGGLCLKQFLQPQVKPGFEFKPD